MTEQTGAPDDDARVGERHVDVTGEDSTPPDSPDAVGDPAIDDVRGSNEGDDVVGDESEPYELRSMPTQPNPTDDDPGSYLNP